MKKEVLYTYLGTNGTITSPVHLEDVYYIRKIRLIPEEGCLLTKDGENFYSSRVVPEEDVDLWEEVIGQG